jgi:hypothetical protein
VSDPHQPGTPTGTDPGSQQFENVQDVAQALGLGTELQGF